MRRYENRDKLLAIGLASLAGFVDALGFLQLRGMFVSFMSGNSTRMAVDVGTPHRGSFFVGALIAAFVIGVMMGTTVGLRTRRRRRQAILALVLLLLTLAGLAGTWVAHSIAATLLMAAAMGAANTVFEREGEVSVGVTYMTGTLVKFAQHLTSALSGGPRFAWAPYFLLWAALIIGAIAGTKAFYLFGLWALWGAVALQTSLLVLSFAPGSAANLADVTRSSR